MAFTPCAVHGALYRGGANTLFIRLVNGATSVGGKLQACADCTTVLLEWFEKHISKVSEGDTFYDFPRSLACANCGGDLGEHPNALFVNAYPRGKSESQWYGQVCNKCVDAVIEDLHLSVTA